MLLRNSFGLILLVCILYLTFFATELHCKRHRHESHEKKTQKRRNLQAITSKTTTMSQTSTTEAREPTPPGVPTTTHSSFSSIPKSAQLLTDMSVAATSASTTTGQPEVHKAKKYKEVKIQPGKIRGEVVEIEPGRKVFTFLGIPYGQPPTGERRFKRPLPVEPWNNKMKDALEYPNSCYQWRDNSFEHYIKGFRGTAMWNTNTQVSEDCLYLNVWTPKKPKSTKMAVMVWIYGGGFYSGTSSLDVYDGKWLAAYQEVVVVSMNYRVGALGFLALNDDEIPGNAGLFDQQLALKWVKANIHKFRGDPNNVTLFGESAGAVSISLHMMSEDSKGLFRNVILQSASSLSPWSILDRGEARRRAVKLADALQCPNMNDSYSNSSTFLSEEEIAESRRVACLQSVDPQELVDVEMNVEGYGIARFPNAPVVDGDFLKVSPHHPESVQYWDHDVNVLAGFNANEGNYFIVYSTALNYDLKTQNTIDNDGFNDGISEVLRSVIDIQNSSNEAKGVLAKSSHFIYTGGYQPFAVDTSLVELKNIRYVPGGEKFSLHNDKRTQIEENVRAQTFYRDRLDDMVGDINFVCPTISFLDKILEKQNSLNNSQSKTYLYKFVHRSSQNPWPDWMGVMHGYEIEFIFGIPMNKLLEYDELERNISKSVMRMWSNFAKHGNPNYGESSVAWPAYNDKHKNMYIIGEQGKGINTRSSLYAGKYSSQLTHCAFWREHLPDVQKRLTGLTSKPCLCPSMSCSGTGTGTTVRISLAMLVLMVVLAVAKSLSLTEDHVL